MRPGLGSRIFFYVATTQIEPRYCFYILLFSPPCSLVGCLVGLSTYSTTLTYWHYIIIKHILCRLLLERFMVGENLAMSARREWSTQQLSWQVWQLAATMVGRVLDPFNFDLDPDPQIRFTKKRIWRIETYPCGSGSTTLMGVGQLDSSHGRYVSLAYTAVGRST